MAETPLVVLDALAPLADGDEYIEVTSYGSAKPEYLVGRRAADIAEAKARMFYIDGLMTVEQFEQAMDVIVRYRATR